MSEKAKKKRSGKAGRRIRKAIKRIVLIAVIAAAALFGTKAYIRSQAESAGEAESYVRAPVIRGAMEETVYGTGTTSARSQPNLLAEADGTLTELRAEIGDEVKKGDILAVLTNEDIDDTITDLEFALWDLDETIRDTAAGSKVTTIESPAKGRIAAVYAKPGDDTLAVFRREGALAILSTDGRMKVELTAKDRVLGLTLDERVTVSGKNIQAEGTVVDLTRQGTSAVITVYENDLPVEMEMRMTAIRERLDKLGTPITRRSLDALWRYCSAVLPYMQCSPMELLDLAITQRGLPTLLSSMPIEALMELPDIFKGMDKCLKLLDEPLPLPALY